MKNTTATTLFCIPLLIASASLSVAAPVSWWAFEKESKEIAHDQAGKISDLIEGEFKQCAGVKGSALKLDGYTTCIVRESAGYSLSAGPRGEIRLRVAVDGKMQEIVSDDGVIGLVRRMNSTDLVGLDQTRHRHPRHSRIKIIRPGRSVPLDKPPGLSNFL